MKNQKQNPLATEGERPLLSKRLHLQTNRSMLDLFLILVLLCGFTISALIIVMIGANVYKSVAGDMQSNFDLRIPLSYISTKVKQHDQAGAVYISEKEGTQVLILESTENKVVYETWIYPRDNQLYEVMIEKGQELSLSDGMAILPIKGLDIKMNTPSLLQVTSYDQTGKTLDLSLNLRSD